MCGGSDLCFHFVDKNKILDGRGVAKRVCTPFILIFVDYKFKRNESHLQANVH